jgi:hypothetical protein
MLNYMAQYVYYLAKIQLYVRTKKGGGEGGGCYIHSPLSLIKVLFLLRV